MIGGRKGGYRRSPGGGSMNKKNPSGGGGSFIFYVGSLLFSPRTRGPCHFFCVCVCVGGGGDFFFCMGGGALLGLSPHNNFCGSLLSQKSFQIVEVLIFFEGAIRSTQKTCPPPPQHQFK